MWVYMYVIKARQMEALMSVYMYIVHMYMYMTSYAFSLAGEG